MPRPDRKPAPPAAPAQPQPATEPPAPPEPWRAWALSALLVALFAVVCCLFPVDFDDADIWWHLKTGEWIVQHRALPTADLFTDTIAPSTRWYDTQWMFQVLAFGVWSAASWNGLIALRCAFAVFFGGACLLWLRERRCNRWVAAGAIAVLLAMCRYRFMIRPELPTFGFLALQLWLLDRAGRTRTMPWAPLLGLQWLWGNWHSSALLGVVLGACAAGQHLLRRLAPAARATAADFHFPPKTLALYIGGLGLALVANPHGPMPLVHGLEFSKSFVLEFQAPDSAFFLGAPMLWGALLLAGLAASRAVPGRNVPLLTAFALGCLYESLQVRRFLPYFGIATLPLAAAGLAGVLRFRVGAQFPWLAHAVRAAVGGVAGAFVLWSFVLVGKPFGRLGLDGRGIPVAAADFVLKHNLPGSLYNEMGPGGYLLWRFAPDRKVHCFGETLINSATLDKMMASKTSDEWRRYFDEYKIQYAVLTLPYRLPPGGGATVAETIFTEWPDFKLVFWDDDAMVFLRETPETRDLIATRRCEIFPEPIAYPGNPLERTEDVKSFFAMPINRARKEAELKRVIQESPRHYRAELGLAMLYEQWPGHDAEALAAIDRALRIFPDFPSPAIVRARFHRNRAQYAEALQALDLAAAMPGGRPRAEAFRVAVLADMGRIAEAERLAMQILRRNPSDQLAQSLVDYVRTRAAQTPPGSGTNTP